MLFTSLLSYMHGMTRSGSQVNISDGTVTIDNESFNFSEFALSDETIGNVLAAFNTRSPQVETIIFKDFQKLVKPVIDQPQSVKNIQFIACTNLEAATLEGLPNLTSLIFENCPALQTICTSRLSNLPPELTFDGFQQLQILHLENLPNLTTLTISNNPALQKFTLKNLPLLTTLTIMNCYSLNDFIIGNPRRFHRDPDFDSTDLPQLRSLIFRNCHNLINPWFYNLPLDPEDNNHFIIFDKCPNLSCPRFTNIPKQVIRFRDCSKLKKPSFK